MEPGVLIVAGATATGKSTLGLALAQRFDAEIVGADSRQVYRDMPIGTAAPTAFQRAQIPHHLIGFLYPHQRYSAAQFTLDALAAIDEIKNRGKRAIVVGGTGFYIRALCGDVALAAERDDELRGRLGREIALHPPEVLHGWLRSLNARRASAIAQGDSYRVVRALEVALSRRYVRTASLPSLRSRGITFVKASLTVAAPVLQERIRERIEAMLRAGLLDEASDVGTGAVASSAVGYPQALAYLAGFCTERELRESLFRATRRYAKRQQTWFRREPGMQWFDERNALDSLSDLARKKLEWA
ncbi:MAG: tRNA (adenosine(37)-N6)-dimethylallyltransferase MiaA [Candidatus Eremiobacteraeota bacterium]|nr:tRNA (adenosine(37)-N6)-dimethylallyltransferase MiaA [Candidatus Eremiobacteraeota bacterium]